VPRPLTPIREAIRRQSPLPAAETERIVTTSFDHVPQRLVTALATWPLERSAVLDVGASFGTCLVQFGPGSLGVDNYDECVRFARALGVDSILVDVEDPDQLARIPDEAFDFLWVSDVLEHLEAPRLLLRRLFPKVKPGGSLLVQTSVLPRNRAARWMFRRIGERPFDAEVHYHQWTADTIRHLLMRAGYRPLRMIPVLPARLAAFARFAPPAAASRLIVEALPDAELRERSDRAVARNLRRL
jgi:SAM-dependent methyltransferase